VFSHSKLREGANTIRLVAEEMISTFRFLTPSSSLTSIRTQQTKIPALQGIQGGMVTINGFSSPDVRVVDITDPANVIMVAATQRCKALPAIR